MPSGLTSSRSPGLGCLPRSAEQAAQIDAAASWLLANTKRVVIPTEAWDSGPVRAFLDGLAAGNGPIRRVVPVDVRQSMANGGGPACLRLRVVADPATVDPRFLLDGRRAETIERVIARHWPEQIDPGDLGAATLAATVRRARAALLDSLELSVLT